MKVKVKKSELRECIKNAVIRAINESKETVNEAWYDDDDDDDAVSRFLRNPKNNPKYDPKTGKIMKRMKGGAAAKAAAMKDIDDEQKSNERDDKAVADRERREMDTSTD